MIEPLFSLTPANIATLILSALVGVVLSFIFFGGLWLTVRRMERSRQPVLLFAGSFIARIAILLVGFYWIADGRIDRLAVCLLSFFITRQFIMRWAQSPKNTGKNLGATL